MGLYSSERGALSKIWCWTIVVVLVLAAMGTVGQTAPSTQDPTPPAAQEKPTPDTSAAVEDTKTVESAAVDVEIQRRFNELRRKLLDDRADTINWWLTIALIVLAVISIGAAFGVYFGLSGLREIKDEAKESAEEVKKSAEEINELKKQAEEDAQQIEQEREQITRANVLSSDPDQAKQAEETLQEVRQKPAASVLDRAIGDAVSLQRAGKREEAIEKWRSIANVTEGSAPDLAALAWLSIGSLLYEKEVEDAGEQ